MIHLLVVALGIFVNGTTGEAVQAIAQVDSVTQCAELINANREPRQAEDGSTWYLTAAECRVVEQK